MAQFDVTFDQPHVGVQTYRLEFNSADVHDVCHFEALNHFRTMAEDQGWTLVHLTQIVKVCIFHNEKYPRHDG
jgi:hypothetical protein